MRVPPGPSGRQALRFLSNGRFAGTLAFLEETARSYGRISSFRVLNKRIYLIDDAELIKEVLVTHQHSFERDSGAGLLRELVGDVLITREEPLHRDRRRILQPAFHRDQIQSYAEIMVAECRRLRDSWNPGQTFDIRAEMRRLTLAIVGSALFGSDFRDSAGRIAKILERVGKRSGWLAPAFAFFEPVTQAYRRAFPNGPSLFFYSERRALAKIIEPILERRQGGSAKDVLSLLLNERYELDIPLSREDVKNEIVTFVLAGHETTATALTWTWHLLGTHSSVTERLHAELDSVLGDKEPSFEDVPRLRYTSFVFQEAMRLFPPALAFARRAKHDLELGGYTIPKHASVFLSPYITQRNERYFPDPHEFRPERWEQDPPPQKFAYFPFGGGAKMCIGEPFARLEGVLAIACLARKWMLEGREEARPGLGPGLLLNPSESIVMEARPRTRAPLLNNVIHATV